MDQEWKNQNQASDNNGQIPIDPAAQAAPAPETTIKPANPIPPSATPLPSQITSTNFSPPDTLTGQNAYGQYTPGAGASRRKIVVSILVLAILAISGGAYAFLGKKQQKVDNQTPGANAANQSQSASQLSVEEKKPVVPIGWKTVDTKLGYSVKAPADWSGANSVPTASDFGIYKSKSMTIGSVAASSGDSAFPFGKYISLGVESITTSTSQADFEKAITDINQIADSLAGLGISKDQVKVTSSKVNINGKQWLRIDSEIPHQFATSLYFWVNDHAVYMTVSNENKDQLNKLVDEDLFPMASSVELK